MPRHFLSLADQSREEVRNLLDLARQIKLGPQSFQDVLRGRTLAMIFMKPSLRTRVSFEVGMSQLGGRALYLGPSEISLGKREPTSDIAQVLSRYVDGIMARVFAHQDVLDLARYATVPVINGLSDLLHPCQVLADLLTIEEKFGRLAGLKMAYIGDGNNMAHSLMNGGARTGMHVAVASPVGYGPDAVVVAGAQAMAEESGGSVVVTGDPREAAAGADVVVTDTWASMGQEAEREERIAKFQGFQVDGALMGLARRHAIFLHCLPAHRGEEVSEEVIDGPQSVIFDEAENRLHAQKAILVRLMGRQGR